MFISTCTRIETDSGDRDIMFLWDKNKRWKSWINQNSTNINAVYECQMNIQIQIQNKRW